MKAGLAASVTACAFVIVVVALGLPARELLAAGRRILEVIET